MCDSDLGAKLAELPAALLASFISELAVLDPYVCERAESLALRSDPEALAGALRGRLDGIVRGQPYNRYNEGSVFARHLDGWLNDVESRLLPGNPRAAWQLVDAFIRSDDNLFEGTDDEGMEIAQALERACALWLRAAAELPPSPEWVERLRALHREDGYGVRGALLDEAALLLSEPELRRLAAVYEQEARGAGDDGHRAGGAGSAMGQIAGALRDAALYERSIRVGSPRPNASQALDIAEQYLKFGPAEQAVAWLEDIESDDRHDPTCLEMLAEAYEKVGNASGLLEVRRELCETALSFPALQRYAALLPEAERRAAVDRAAERASASHRPIPAAALLLDLDEPAQAETLLLEHREELAGEFYGDLRHLAARFERARCALGSVLCHRALVDQILAAGRSPAYRYAKRYLDRLATLEKQLDDSRGLVNHAAYLQQLRATHPRKWSFWKLVDG